MDGKKVLKNYKKDLTNFHLSKTVNFTKILPVNSDTGPPTSKIRIELFYQVMIKKDLLNKIIKTLDENNALIVRMNTEKNIFPNNTQYISRFAISIRDENAPECLSQMVKVAGEMKLTFRYETS